MGLFSSLKNQFIDVVEWPDENPDILVHRFQRHDNEAANAAAHLL